MRRGVWCATQWRWRSAGGDGTWSAAADRIMQSGRTDVALGLLPAGTGNDFGKSVGVRVDTVESVVEAIAQSSHAGLGCPFH